MQPLLDAVVDFLPSPLDVPAIKGIDLKTEPSRPKRKSSDDEPFAALAFKVMADKYVGTLTFARVYSGRHECRRSDAERGQGFQSSASAACFRCMPIAAEDIQEARAGDIIAFCGLKEHDHRRYAVRSHQGDHSRAHGIPGARLSRSRSSPRLRPTTDKMGVALTRLADEDPSFRVGSDEESGQTIISGMGELHLEIIVDRMKREFSVEANVGASRRSPIARPSPAKPISSRRHPQEADRRRRPVRSRIKATFGPGEPGSGFEFENKHHRRQHSAGVHPRSIQSGIASACQTGVIAGFPVIDVSR